MRNNLILAAAVAATFAGVSASASTVDIYVSGSSALQTFFQKDLAVSICGQAVTAISSSNISVSYKDTTLASTAGQPGYTYYSCVANGTVTGFASGNIYALHYASDLGSTWGVAGSITPSLTRETILTNVGCGTSTCNDTAHFDRVNDKSAALEAASVMGQHKSDILTFDVEPTLFSGDNWPSANSDVTNIPAKLATAPTAAQLAGITTSNMNEQIFGVIVSNNTPGVGMATGNAAGSSQAPSLSTNSIRAIFTGQYTYWNQVPEVGSADTASTQIVLCRRDHGSGSEIAASLTFTGVECGVSSNAIATTASSGNLNAVIENPTSQDVKNCVQNASSVSGLSGAVAGIGLVGIGFSASYTTVNIDGYQANAHNVAAGLYNMAYEAHAKDNTANSGASADTKTVVSALLLDATKQAKLTNFYSETATQAAVALNPSNQFNVASTPAGYTALQAGNPASVIGSSFISNKTPVVLFDRGGNSCTAKSNSN